jgi:hypothetical protein
MRNGSRIIYQLVMSNIIFLPFVTFPVNPSSGAIGIFLFRVKPAALKRSHPRFRGGTLIGGLSPVQRVIQRIKASRMWSIDRKIHIQPEPLFDVGQKPLAQ